MTWRGLAAAALCVGALAGCDPDLNDNECRTNAECAAILPGTVCSPEHWCVLPEAVQDPDMARPDAAPEPEPDAAVDMAPEVDMAQTADVGPDMAPEVDMAPMGDGGADMAPEGDMAPDPEPDAGPDMAPEGDMGEGDMGEGDMMIEEDMGEPVDPPPM